ncbi:hypothetical protein GCM10008966_31020 [Rhodovulum strictum]
MSGPTVTIPDMTALPKGSSQTRHGTSMPPEGGHIIKARMTPRNKAAPGHWSGPREVNGPTRRLSRTSVTRS